ncbi:hypothetical protein [Rathayibacter sp. VKM Ac-2927]|uniref:hypothetical protein n=1 Tax=Rathayibacter sp. VKM Ac-2927 TaxID=2929478 RepID=UPI001FB46A95|nr:hypothetical protein [Rathayibacter sp. VKM Ac-2927]MCJ1687771.1 hypothetical protein [Rathayibacter sp. VKM Ac-2927]
MTTLQQLALLTAAPTITPCARHHAARDVHADDCPGTDVCHGCYPAAARYGHLCGPCYSRIRYWLRYGHELAMHAFTLRTPSLGSSLAQTDRVDSTRAWRLPFNEQAVEATDLFFGQLADVVKNHATELHVAPPAFLFDRWRRDEDINGFPKDTDLGKADVLLAELIRFELAHGPKIAALDTIVVWYDELAEMIRTLRGRFPIDPPPTRPRTVPCPVCDQHRLVITRDIVNVETIRCEYCQWTPASDVETDAVLTEGATA